LAVCNDYLLSSCYDNTIRVWDLKMYQQKCILCDDIFVFKIVSDLRKNFIYMHDVRDGIIKVWDLNTFQYITSLNTPNNISCALFIKDNYLYSSNGDDIKIWNLDTHQKVATLPGHQKSVKCITMSLFNKKILYSGSFDKTIKIWNLETFKEIDTLFGHDYSVRFLEILSNGKIYSSDMWDDISVWSSNDISLKEELKLITEYLKYYTNSLIETTLRCFLIEETSSLL
jgi:WD40 repeat protein